MKLWLEFVRNLNDLKYSERIASIHLNTFYNDIYDFHKIVDGNNRNIKISCPSRTHFLTKCCCTESKG